MLKCPFRLHLRQRLRNILHCVYGFTLILFMLFILFNDDDALGAAYGYPDNQTEMSCSLHYLLIKIEIEE